MTKRLISSWRTPRACRPRYSGMVSSAPSSHRLSTSRSPVTPTRRVALAINPIVSKGSDIVWEIASAAPNSRSSPRSRGHSRVQASATLNDRQVASRMWSFDARCHRVRSSTTTLVCSWSPTELTVDRVSSPRPRPTGSRSSWGRPCASRGDRRRRNRCPTRRHSGLGGRASIVVDGSGSLRALGGCGAYA